MDSLDLHLLTGYLVRRAQQAHVASWQQKVSPHVSSVQFGVLNELARHPGASQTYLCDALDLDRSTIADLVKRLQNNGLIRRTRDSEDRRRNVLKLSEAGEQTYRSLIPGVLNVEAQLTAGMNPNDVAELRRLLSLLLAGGRPPAQATERSPA